MQRDLRQWITEIERIGEIRRLEQAHWDLEIGTICSIINDGRSQAPAILFDNIPDYPKGYRLLANALGSPRRLAVTLGIPTPSDVTTSELVKLWRNKLRDITPIPYVVVPNGPVMENVHTGSDVNVLEFPAPRWHELDGGRYIGTACLVITKDPDEGWVNVGTYRIMVHDERTLGFYIAPGKHGWQHREKYFKRGLPCPVAVCFGQDPILFLASSIEVPYGICEYDYAGGILGEPIEVVEGPVTGLPVPATAEIVVEGEAVPGDTRVEGPFGEWTGYYGSSSRPEPVIRVKSVMHRSNPILCGAPPTRPPSEQTFFKGIISSGLIWDELEKAGIPGIQGVWRDTRFWVVVSIKQRYPGHAKQAGLVASQCHAGAYLGRYVIVVDDDIDPTNTHDVLWALMTRSDPATSIEIVKRCWSGPLDPIIPPGQKGLNSRAVIEACKPFEWIERFPATVEPSKELRNTVYYKWREALGVF